MYTLRKFLHLYAFFSAYTFVPSFFIQMPICAHFDLSLVFAHSIFADFFYSCTYFAVRLTLLNFSYISDMAFFAAP